MTTFTTSSTSQVVMSALLIYTGLYPHRNQSTTHTPVSGKCYQPHNEQGGAEGTNINSEVLTIHTSWHNMAD